VEAFRGDLVKGPVVKYVSEVASLALRILFRIALDLSVIF